MNLAEADLTFAVLSGANLSEATIREANLCGADLRKANLRGADLSAANLSNADLREADLCDANLSGAYFREADLRQANLSGAYLHPAFGNEPGANLNDADLQGADLSGTVLRGANLSGANLSGADLRGAGLNWTDLSGADLSGANLNGADLSQADLNQANLSGAGLTEANLASARLHSCSLTGASFDRARFGWTTVISCLLDCDGLATADHHGPTSIDVETLYRSFEFVPEVFWRKAGVPEHLLAYLPELIAAAGDSIWYSCFLSHSTQDRDFCNLLHRRLLEDKVRVYYAPEKLKSGQKLAPQLLDAIRHHDKLLLVLSPQSMQSEWVKTEIYEARQVELKDNRQVLFPIGLVPYKEIRDWHYFDADTGKDLAREIREYFVPDFSDWRDEASFENAYHHLLDSLRHERPRPTSLVGGFDSK